MNNLVVGTRIWVPWGISEKLVTVTWASDNGASFRDEVGSYYSTGDCRIQEVPS